MNQNMSKLVQDGRGNTFEMLEYLGGGTYGKVYKARWYTGKKPQDPEYVALKQYLPKKLPNGQWDHFDAWYEADVFNYTNQFDLLYLVKTLLPLFEETFTPSDPNQAHTIYYSVMQLCEGPTMYDFLQDSIMKPKGASVEKQMKDSQLLLRLMIQLTVGIKELQQICLSHHDLKPTNMIVNPLLEKLTVVDVGLACFIKDCQPPLNRNMPVKLSTCRYGTRTTTGYNPFEVYKMQDAKAQFTEAQVITYQERKEQDYDSRAFDLYALGQIFKEMTSGQFMWQEKDGGRKLNEIVAEAPPTPKDKLVNTRNAALDNMISQMMHPDAQHRLTIDEVLQVLKKEVVRLQKPFPITDFGAQPTLPYVPEVKQNLVQQERTLKERAKGQPFQQKKPLQRPQQYPKFRRSTLPENRIFLFGQPDNE